MKESFGESKVNTKEENIKNGVNQQNIKDKDKIHSPKSILERIAKKAVLGGVFTGIAMGAFAKDQDSLSDKEIFNQLDENKIEATTEDLKINLEATVVQFEEGNNMNQDNLSPEEAIELARKSQLPQVWAKVLVRTDIHPEEAIKLAKEVNVSFVSGVVLSRIDISSEEALDFAQKNPIILGYIFSNKENLELEDAINLTHKLKHNESLLFLKLINRTNIPLDKAVKIAKFSKNLDVWKILVRRPDFKLNKDVIEDIHKLQQDRYIFSELLNRPNISLDEAVEAAKASNENEDVWMILISRPDLSLEKAVEVYGKGFYSAGSYDPITNIMLNKPEASIEGIVKLMTENKINPCWGILLGKSGCKEYLKNLSAKESFDLAVRFQDYYLIKGIISNPDLPVENIVDIISSINPEDSKLYDLFQEYTEKSNIIEYLKNVNVEKAIELMKKAHRFTRIPEILSSRSDVMDYLSKQ